MDLVNDFINILEGCLLGDGCLELGKNSKNACFKYISSSKEHCTYVHSFFKIYCTDNYQEVKKKETYDNRTDKIYTAYYFRTKCLPIFTLVHSKFYKNSKKVIPPHIDLTNKTKLLWYIGDGELESSHGYIKLHTNSFTQAEVQYLCSLLVDYKAKPLKKKTGVYLVSIPRTDVKQFLQDIGDCPINDYNHKWRQVPYKNKNIEKHGVTNHSTKLKLIKQSWGLNEDTIYSLALKYNVPINSIKNYFNKHNIPWKSKKTNKEIEQYDLDGNLVKVWVSGQDIKRTLNYNNSRISECCRGLREKYKEYVWKFKNTDS